MTPPASPTLVDGFSRAPVLGDPVRLAIAHALRQQRANRSLCAANREICSVPWMDQALAQSIPVPDAGRRDEATRALFGTAAETRRVTADRQAVSITRVLLQ